MSDLFYSSGQASRELSVTPETIRNLCQRGAIRAEITPGGQWRIPKDEVARLKRDGIPETARPLPNAEPVLVGGSSRPRRSNGTLLAEPSEVVIDAAEQVVVLENEVKAIGLKRQKEEGLDWFRDREDREAEREWEREEAERERLAQAQAARERAAWEARWIANALDTIPYSAPTDLRIDVHQAVENTLSSIQPSCPDGITRRLVDAAVERELGPWRRRQEGKKAVEAACDKLPHEVRYRPEFRDAKQLAVQSAEAAIAQLPPDASRGDLEVAAISAVMPFVKAAEHYQTCNQIVSSVWLSTGSGELKEAKESVRHALTALPVGTPVPQLKAAKESALAAYRARIAERERAAQQQRREQTARAAAEFRVDSILVRTINGYLDREYEYDVGHRGIAERHKDVERIRKTIREPLVKECMARPEMTLQELGHRIERLARQYSDL